MQKNIPVLTVSGTTLAEAYEKALVELYTVLAFDLKHSMTSLMIH